MGMEQRSAKKFTIAVMLLLKPIEFLSQFLHWERLPYYPSNVKKVWSLRLVMSSWLSRKRAWEWDDTSFPCVSTPKVVPCSHVAPYFLSFLKNIKYYINFDLGRGKKTGPWFGSENWAFARRALKVWKKSTLRHSLSIEILKIPSFILFLFRTVAELGVPQPATRERQPFLSLLLFLEGERLLHSLLYFLICKFRPPSLVWSLFLPFTLSCVFLLFLHDLFIYSVV